MRKTGQPHRRKRGHPASDLLSLFQRQGGRCFYCRGAMDYDGCGPSQATRDHVVPRSRRGKTAGNVVAACYDCNQRKASMPPSDFRQWMAGLTCVRTFHAAHSQDGTAEQSVLAREEHKPITRVGEG